MCFIGLSICKKQLTRRNSICKHLKLQHGCGKWDTFSLGLLLASYQMGMIFHSFSAERTLYLCQASLKQGVTTIYAECYPVLPIACLHDRTEKFSVFLSEKFNLTVFFSSKGADCYQLVLFSKQNKYFRALDVSCLSRVPGKVTKHIEKLLNSELKG